MALDGVANYLPSPFDKNNFGYRKVKNEDGELIEEKIDFFIDEKRKFVGYAFKLEESKFGQLTYIRVYQGKLRKGDYVYNMATKKKTKVYIYFLFVMSLFLIDYYSFINKGI